MGFGSEKLFQKKSNSKFTEFVNSLSEEDFEELKNEIENRSRDEFLKSLFTLANLRIVFLVFLLEFSIEALVEILFD